MNLGNLLRRVRFRGLVEGKVQRARVEALEGDARDDAEHWHDYGFTARPMDGEGLRIEVGGHTILLRADRINERPQLAAFEVSVWHKEGHRVTLKAGGLVEASCTTFRITGALEVVGPITAVGDVVGAGVSLSGHTHGGVDRGGSQTDPPAE